MRGTKTGPCNPRADWGYNKIITVYSETASGVIKVTYNPHREMVRKMNRIFNGVAGPQTDTSSPVWEVV